MNYHKIYYDNMLNGDGLRVVLFVSGCDHHCSNCQNKMTWDHRSGKEFDDKALSEIENYLKKDYIDGITFSGGDPLYKYNFNEILSLSKYLKDKYPNKTIWLYTGYTIEEIASNPEYIKILKYIDVLVDGKFDESLKDINYRWAGSTNQRVIDINKTISNKSIVIYKN